MSFFSARIALTVANISIFSLTLGSAKALDFSTKNVKEKSVQIDFKPKANTDRLVLIADADSDSPGSRLLDDGTAAVQNAQPVKANIVTADDAKNPAPQEAPSQPAKPVITGAVVASDLEQEYAKKHHKTFVGKMVKGVSQEFGSSLEYMAKDSAFVFSAQDYDANKSSAPKNKPYEDYHIRWVDGTRSNIIRYPNGEQVIATGHRAGTVITPIDKSKSDILYSNGQHGTLIKSDEGGYTIVRDKKVIMQLSPKIGGGYYISNANGEMGTIEPSVVDTHYGYYSMRDNMGDF